MFKPREYFSRSEITHFIYITYNILEHALKNDFDPIVYKKDGFEFWRNGELVKFENYKLGWDTYVTPLIKIFEKDKKVQKLFSLNELKVNEIIEIKRIK